MKNHLSTRGIGKSTSWRVSVSTCGLAAPHVTDVGHDVMLAGISQERAEKAIDRLLTFLTEGKRNQLVND